ncbi:hypothetical protein Acr_27g0000280 [Actinidia rufa]|uniref:Uncharacterized protein n=1 Tax=Actinidia rufa TaxID=165716 RepID=A0A7J0H5F5_9ERIC|nr:hypothetical protein Acr_27g0000280 [Actinidia rufa]
MLKEVMARCHLTFKQVFVNFVQIVLVVDKLMHEMELPFSVEDLVHVYTVVRPKRESGSSLLEDFNDQFKRRSKECKDAIQVINKRQESRKVIDILAYEPIYQYMIPHKAEELEGIRLRVKSSLSEALFKCKGRELVPEFSTVELGKQVTVDDSTKIHDISLALALEIILPKGVTDLVEQGSKKIREVLVMQQVQSLQRASTIVEQMKEQSTEIKRSKNKISSLEKQVRMDPQTTKKAKLEFVPVM